MTSNPDDDLLGQATQLLRQHTDAGWTAISADILNRAMRAFRPSEPVRGRHQNGDFFVAGDVLIGQLRQALDAIAHGAPTRITCTTDDDHHLTDVTIQITAAYGTHLLTLAEHFHNVATHTLTTELGELAPDTSAIHTHVHIADVTDDPRDLI